MDNANPKYERPTMGGPDDDGDRQTIMHYGRPTMTGSNEANYSRNIQIREAKKKAGKAPTSQCAPIRDGSIKKPK